MFNVRAFSIGKAHEEVIKTILKHGIYIVTEDNEKTIELPEPLNIHVGSPFADYMISPYNMFKQGAMEKYVQDLLYGTDNDFVYTYHNRLFDYPVAGKNGEILGDGDKKGINQIDYIVEKLTEEPSSRRAEAITWFTTKDEPSNNPPCLQRIQCFIRDKKLNMHVEFRSNDMLSALGANMYALVHLQKMIADRLNAKTGWYSHTSVSAHMYHERDHEELVKYIKGLGIEDSLKNYEAGAYIKI
ncbi:thymidylate synthase [Methanomicrobium sp. W14]|uniref:thymidylate synthase n=1 Tax=Methanomicrobium sp. W14 TaxID=2817839 RepID=UPI001AEAC1A7|nr:thymidylate synthase [Methanomicrobium sp. W14]MBP2133689.1 thymidylate synthase [Methanomicrobium sp. W14]